MKTFLSVCLVLLLSVFPGLGLAESGNGGSPAIDMYVKEISQVTG